MAWCFSTRASVATVLGTHPNVSSCLWVNTFRLTQYSGHLEIFAFIVLYESVCVLIQSSLNSVPSGPVKDRAHLSTLKNFIFEKFSCFIVLVVFLVIVQSSELISVWFCEKKWHFFSYHIFAIYVGGASLGLPTACRLIAVSGARLPSVDGLVVRCIKMHHQVKSAITICLQFI